MDKCLTLGLERELNCPQETTDVGVKATKVIKALEHLSYEERLQELEPEAEKAWLGMRDLVSVCKSLVV